MLAKLLANYMAHWPVVKGYLFYQDDDKRTSYEGSWRIVGRDVESYSKLIINQRGFG